VFLSADESTPKKLVADGLAVASSLFTYAVGKLVLFTTNATLVTGEQTLRVAKFNNIAIADPAAAPYGTAAVQVMKALGVYDALASKIVQGSNIAQTFQFVETGNAELGFVKPRAWRRRRARQSACASNSATPERSYRDLKRAHACRRDRRQEVPVGPTSISGIGQLARHCLPACVPLAGHRDHGGRRRAP
jgi:molybdenum ABC transporter molybdate-binding protein